MNFFMGTPQNPSGGLSSLIFLVLIMIVFYVFFFLPLQRKQREHQKMIASLEKGDRVITSGGIIAVVQSINREKGIAQLKIAENVKIEIQLSHISSKIVENEGEKQ